MASGRNKARIKVEGERRAEKTQEENEWGVNQYGNEGRKERDKEKGKPRQEVGQSSLLEVQKKHFTVSALAGSSGSTNSQPSVQLSQPLPLYTCFSQPTCLLIKNHCTSLLLLTRDGFSHSCCLHFFTSLHWPFLFLPVIWFLFFFFNFLKIVFVVVFFGLHCVFVAVRGLSLVVVSGLQCTCFSPQWLLLWSTGSRARRLQ